MSEMVLAALIGVGGVFIGGAVTWFVTLRKMPKELRVLNSEEQENLSVALNNAVTAYNTSLGAANAQRKDFEQRISELEAHRTERGRQIYTLETTIEQLKQTMEARDREYIKETQALRGKLAEYEMIIKQLIVALQEVDPALLERIDLTDTLQKIKTIGK